jgi:ketosteroid isomerase-like protein
MNEQQNVAVVREAYAAYKRGDMPGLLNTMADDVGWFLPGPKEILPYVGKRQGKQQVAQFFTTVAATQEAEQFDPSEFIAQGDRVVVLGHYRWHVKSTGRNFSSDFVHVFTCRNGKIGDFHEHFDTHAAATALSSAQSAAGR